MSLIRSASASVARSESAAAAARNPEKVRRFIAASEREPRGVEEARQPARTIARRERALAAVEDPRVGHLVRRDRVVGSDVDRPHDALKADQLLTLVQREPLLAADEQVAVRQPVRDGHGDVAVEAVALARVRLTRGRALPGDLRVQDRPAVARDRAAGEDRNAGVDLGALRGRRARGLRRVRALDQRDRQDVADRARAEVHEELEARVGGEDRAGRTEEHTAEIQTREKYVWR